MHNQIERLVERLALPTQHVALAVADEGVLVRGRGEEPCRNPEVAVRLPATLGAIPSLDERQRPKLCVVRMVQQPVRGQHLEAVAEIGCG